MLFRSSAFCASVVAESARGRNMSGCRRSWKSESEAKMIATSKLCAVAVYVTNAIVAARTGTENAAAMLGRGLR